MSGDRGATAAMDAFLQAYIEDLRAGRSRPLDHYQHMFPGHEGAIDAAWRECHDGDTAPDAQPLAPPAESIGHYEILRELGRGGQGIVYLARDRHLRREVALKVFPRAAAAPMIVHRMRREAEALSRIDDRGICSVYEFGETAREAFIAMRHVPGRTLAEELRDEVSGSPASSSASRRRGRRYLQVIERVARSIHKAHEIGIVHRDLKPGNIIIDPEDCPVVLDFGLARDDTEEGPTLTQTGDVLGTPAYMPPELVSGRAREADARCDVYALGVCLYECLTRRRPFSAPTREELLRQILWDDPPDPRRIDRSIPRDVATIAAIAMSKDRGRRYATALDFAEDLRRVQADESILARRPGIAERALRYLRRRPLQSALGLTVLVAVVLGGYLASRWSDLEAEDARHRALAIEDVLEAALDSIASNAVVESCLSRLDAAEKAAGPTTEVAVGRVLCLARMGKGQQALQILDAIADRDPPDPALQWARWRVMLLLKTPGTDQYRQGLGEPPDGLCALISGIVARERLANSGPELLKPEITRMLRTVLGSPVPRRSFHLLLVGLASEAGNKSTAMAAAEAMLRLWPEATSSWTAMGYACQQADPVRAIRCFRKAIALGADPRPQGITVLLANAYSAAGDEEACIRTYRDALAVPGGFSRADRALALYNLGDSLYVLGDWEAAVESNRLIEEIHGSNPGRLQAQALCNMAHALIRTTRWAEALEVLRQGHTMGAGLEGWSIPSGEWLADMATYVGLAEKVPALHASSTPPAEDARPWQWAAAATLSGHYATSAKWFRHVHGPDAMQVDGLVGLWASRFVAATSSVRAAEGEGADAASTEAAARAALRELGLSWLDSELDQVERGIDSASLPLPNALRRLQRWNSGPGLAPLRSVAAVRQFPPAQQDRLRTLWARWEHLIARARPAY